ncbi:MAG: carbon-nitrogen hydrolase family protein [Mangrovicoccus sp.]|nr:carbon-nitrogen hydrolase family protein [Mangrovicoccus sp.]
MLAGLVQMTSSDQPEENLTKAREALRHAARGGADLVLTPEVTNCLSSSRRHQQEVLRPEAEDLCLAGLRDAAAAEGVWLLIGSLALKTDDPDGRFANRSFLISPDGEIVARYDKIHMFDVDLSATERYRESDGYRRGDAMVLAHTPFAALGMSICYDLRFPYLYRALAQQGAQVLTVPAAFARATGRGHWEILLRARAIETGCFVMAPAQTGNHRAIAGKSRTTWGHSLAISPWGEVLLDLGDLPSVGLVKVELDDVAKARSKVPSVRADVVVGSQ